MQYTALYFVAIVLVWGVSTALFLIKGHKDKQRYKLLTQKQIKVQNSDKNPIENDEENLFKLQTSACEKDEKSVDVSAHFEDFCLDPVKKENSPARLEIDKINPFVQNLYENAVYKDNQPEQYPFDINKENDEDDIQNLTEDEDDFSDFEEEEDKSLDDKFKEYEEFLRKNLDLDDDFDINEDETDENLDAAEDFEATVGKETSWKNPQLSTPVALNYDVPLDDDLNLVANFDFNSVKGKSQEDIMEILKDLPPRARELILTDILARKLYEEEG